MRAVGVALTSSLLGLVLAGCGVTIGADSGETEIFKGLSVQGSFAAATGLSITLKLEQPYPVPLFVVCEVLEDRSGPARERTVSRILRERLEANEQGGAVEEATPVPSTIEQTFPGPTEPGRYVIRCFTEADKNNRIERHITVGPAATPEP